MPHVTTSQLRDALDAVDFPADKDAILAQAKPESQDVDRALRSLPPVEYGNVDEVVRSVTVDVT